MEVPLWKAPLWKPIYGSPLMGAPLWKPFNGSPFMGYDLCIGGKSVSLDWKYKTRVKVTDTNSLQYVILYSPKRFHNTSQ